MFATMFVGVLDPESGILSYVNGGHDPPIVLDKTGNVIDTLSPTGPAVGLFPDLDFSVKKIMLNKGDILFAFTDGTTDARDKTGKFFTEKRLYKILSSPWPSAFSMLYDLNSAVQKHIGEQDQYDDITQFSLRRKIKTGDNIHAITRKAIPENLGELRNFAEKAALNFGLNPEHAFAYKLAAEEICNNIIQYGFESQEAGIIALSFTCEKGKAILTITDDGKYFSPDQAKVPDIKADWKEREMGGLGIYFVKELMDNVSYNKTEDNRNELIMEKEL
jgi:anti-sigma regulatory factor (Ser/Thr protein kinase)